MIEQRFHYVYVVPDENGNPCYIGAGKGRRIKRHMQWAQGDIIDGNKAKSEYLIDCLNREIAIEPYKVAEELTREEALAYEQVLIAWYGRRDLGTGVLFNASDGGIGTNNMSPITKQRIREQFYNPTPKILEGWRQASLKMKGRKKPTFSEETCKRISIGRMNWNPSIETRKRMSQGQIGRKHPTEIRMKMSLVAQKRTPEDRARIAAKRKMLKEARKRALAFWLEKLQ